jgi:hypothetical protein
MMHMDFRSDGPKVINWSKRVARFLDNLPSDGFTPQQDWQIIQALAKGEKLPEIDGAKLRAAALMDAVRDDHGTLTLAGRAALIKAAEARAGA